MFICLYGCIVTNYFCRCLYCDVVARTFLWILRQISYVDFFSVTVRMHQSAAAAAASDVDVAAISQWQVLLSV